VPPPKRYAKLGEATYDASKYAARHQTAKEISVEPVKLSGAQRKQVSDAVVVQIAKLPLVPAALAVSCEHCHLLSKFGKLDIRPTAGVLKGEATKALHESRSFDGRVWADECHMKSKKDGREFQIAFKYVCDHVKEGAVVYVWPGFRHLVKTR
jgi:hypothetical protein